MGMAIEDFREISFVCTFQLVSERCCNLEFRAGFQEYAVQ
jgi:hypothetical protein